MTKYLNKLSISVIIFLVLIAGGCKKFLNQTPITEVGADKVFADAAGAYKALVGVYSRLVGDAGYGIRLSLYYRGLTMTKCRGPTGNPDNDRRDIARYAAVPTRCAIAESI